MKNLSLGLNCLRAVSSSLGIALVTLALVPVAQAQPVISNAPGYVITWDGTDGVNPTPPNVPTNIASASQGAVAFASGQLGPEIGAAWHYATNLNDGCYGNTNSWIGGTNDPTPWFAGIHLTNSDLVPLTGIAWGRDNSGASQDRCLGTYTLQISTNATFTTTAADWITLGTITYTKTASGFRPWLRHRFSLARVNAGPVLARNVRLLVPGSGLDANGTAIDEVELFCPAVTTLSHWRMGENDPGAAPGGATSTADPYGGRTMTMTGAAAYDLSVSATASARVGSALSLFLVGGSYGTNAVIPGLTNNFGIELWVRPSATNTTQCIAYNGNSASSGWGLYISGGQYQGLFGGLTFVGGAPAVPGVWTHLALVRNSGVATLYVNGVPAGATATAPNSPSGIFAVAAQPQNPALDNVSGSAYLDELRVFTFVPGAFSTNDLLLNLGLVTTTADSGSGSLRQVITDWNLLRVPGKINFSVNGTITLASDLPVSTVPVTIVGPGTNLLTINGSNSFRLFQLAANTTNFVGGLTLANGFTANDNSGAALYNLGYTIVTNCLFRSNSVVGGFGGAVANSGAGTLFTTNCVFVNNTIRGGDGGSGLHSSGGSGGGGAGMGGAIYTEGLALTVSACSFQSNLAAGGNGGTNLHATFLGGILGANGGFPNAGPGGPSFGALGGAGGFGGGGGGGGQNANGSPGGFGGGGGGGGHNGDKPGGAGGAYGANGGQGVYSPNFTSGGGGGGAGLGAGIFARTGALSVVNCAFTSNVATNGIGGAGANPGGNGQGVGGAIFILDASLNLVNPTFSGNTAATAQPNVGGPATVANTNDSGSGSLREAVAATSTFVRFATNLSGQTITLASQLTLSNTMTIDASALPGGILLNGNASSRIFEVLSGSTVVLDSLTLTNGRAISGDGGGILNAGNLTVNRCTLVGNKADRYGGGIENNNTQSLVINQSTLTANQCSGSGGAALDISYGPVLLQHCTVVGNVATSLGGAGGIANYSSGVTIDNSIVAGNSSAGPAVNFDGNSINFTGVNLTTGNPLLAPLGKYGGLTPTMPPLPDSPVLNAAIYRSGFTTDQRGLPRVVGPYADLGAVEGVFDPNYPLVNVTKLGSGNVQFGFANLSGPSYRVLASTNVAAPINTWIDLGAPTEAPAGTFTFTDLSATNYPSRFYRVTTP